MNRKLIVLLAVALLSRLAAPATAEGPGVCEPDWATAPKKGFMIDGANLGRWEDTRIVWYAYAWCHSGLGVEVAASQGEIAAALGVPITPAQEGSDAAPRGDDELDTSYSCCGFTEPSHSANGVTGVGPLLERCQNAEYALGSVVGLPTAYLEPMGIGGYAPPPGVIVWTEERASPFHVGTSVSFVTGFCSTGLHGPQSMSEFMGTGCSVSVGYTMPTGMEVQIFVHGFVGQQFTTR